MSPPLSNHVMLQNHIDKLQQLKIMISNYENMKYIEKCLQNLHIDNTNSTSSSRSSSSVTCGKLNNMYCNVPK